MEGTEPPEAFGVGHCGVRGRGGGQDEEPGLAELLPLQAKLGPLAERAFVRRLADERDGARPKVAGEEGEPLGGAGEVAAAEVSGPPRRPLSRVREAEPEIEERELLGGLKEPRGEACFFEQAPEVVPRIGEVRAGGGGAPAGVDPTEEPGQPGPFAPEGGEVTSYLVRARPSPSLVHQD